MQTFWIIVAGTNLAVVAILSGMLVWGERRVRRLADVAAGTREGGPRVSVVVAARNEARHIESALQSLLQLDYADYEVLVVDDRSTDETGEILERLARSNARLTVHHVRELPPGWLGKNHALACGAEQAAGSYLLFTDADVGMDASVLRRAMAYVAQTDADHLAVSPDVILPGLLLESLVGVFINVFSIYVRPWKVEDPRSPAFVGVGAFNLLKREVYEAVGTMRAIAMRPDDDVKLGKIVKRHGYRQRFLSGRGLIHVPWYATFKEMKIGLEKNLFAGIDYSLPATVAGSAAFLFTDLWPFVALGLWDGWAWWLSLAAALLLFGQALHAARVCSLSRWSAVLFPLAVVLFAYIHWRAVILTYWRNGICWRDTHYPLAELRANKV